MPRVNEEWGGGGRVVRAMAEWPLARTRYKVISCGFNVFSDSFCGTDFKGYNDDFFATNRVHLRVG